jgi:DNA-binding IclR family transcriptional regulator
VLKYLSEHPSERFTLTELARALDLNMATCHAMLAAFVDHGFLHRSPEEKTYALGPAILALARGVLSEQIRAVELAVEVIRAFRRELGAGGYVTRLDHMETVILARAGTDEAVVYPLGREPRRAWRPPIGPVHAAYADPAVRARWLDQIEGESAESRREYYRELLDTIRRQGLDLVSATDLRGRLTAILEHVDRVDVERIGGTVADLARDGVTEERLPVPDLADHAEQMPIHSINAPVFGSAGAVVLTVTLNPAPIDGTREELEQLVRRVRADVVGVTRAIGGVLPADWPAHRT